jgi:hypothetical protein
MKTLKRLGMAVALTVVLGLSAFAGETQTPPCAPPDPGETNAPPCLGAQMTSDDPVAPGQTETPLCANEGNESSITVAIDLVQSWLPIF